MLERFHPLHSDLPNPAKFTNPFNYEPHPLCLAAAAEVQGRIAADDKLRADADRGKMFGVLVAETADGRRGYLAAYSGLLAGRNDHEYFVPPVFDAMRPDGYFKTREAEITVLNRRIDDLRHSPGYAAAKAELAGMAGKHRDLLDEYRRQMAAAKLRRDARRGMQLSVTAEEEADMIRESQHMKAEYRRLKRRCADEEAAVRNKTEAIECELSELKKRRRQMSDDLQGWLFSQYSMLDALGRRRDLCSIFADTPGRVPPSGAGDCCAPKLLQHAYLNGLRPVCMAEFWWGASPEGEVRHHLHYYPACRGKCLPILTHMLQGLDVDEGQRGADVGEPLEIVYEDDWLAVVCKPAGMASVPGKECGTSVLEEMRLRRPDKPEVMLAHRLDMDTSGLIIVAYDMETYKSLQAQFMRREVGKQYTALLAGVPCRPESGRISLPLSPDPLDRPYQKVDRADGKEAVTDYRIVGRQGARAIVELFPITGRTHQLRVHCAHADGLGTPIVGDRLYGRGGGRLCLHAEAVEFRHPATGRQMRFERKAPSPAFPKEGSLT